MNRPLKAQLSSRKRILFTLYNNYNNLVEVENNENNNNNNDKEDSKWFEDNITISER